MQINFILKATYEQVVDFFEDSKHSNLLVKFYEAVNVEESKSGKTTLFKIGIRMPETGVLSDWFKRNENKTVSFSAMMHKVHSL